MMKTKTKLQISNIFIVLFFVFWQAESWYFIIRDGWHWEAETQLEKNCDYIALALFWIAFAFYISCLNDVIKAHIYLTDLTEKGVDDGR
jgi:hypothetical protein